MHKMYYLTRKPKEKETIPASHVPACFSSREVLSVAAKVAAKEERFLEFGTSAREREGHWDLKDSRYGGTSERAEQPQGHLLHFT